jgi:hypothetical protein
MSRFSRPAASLALLILATAALATGCGGSTTKAGSDTTDHVLTGKAVPLTAYTRDPKVCVVSTRSGGVIVAARSPQPARFCRRFAAKYIRGERGLRWRLPANDGSAPRAICTMRRTGALVEVLERASDSGRLDPEVICERLRDANWRPTSVRVAGTS